MINLHSIKPISYDKTNNNTISTTNSNLNEEIKNRILKESLNYDNKNYNDAISNSNFQKNSNDIVSDPIPSNSNFNEDSNNYNKIELESKLAEATDTLRQHYQERLDIANDEISKLKTEINTLKISITAIGNQRDFYYNKLRDVEMLTHKNQGLDKEEILDILKTVIFSEQEVELIYDDQGKVSFKHH